jgi:hypothetical protein
LKFLAAQGGDLRLVGQTEVLCNIDPFETGQAAHSHVVELRQQKRIDEVPAIDAELWVIDRLFSDLKA